MNDTPDSRRREYQFSLRTMFVGMTVACIMAACLGTAGRVGYRAYIENFTFYELDGPLSPDGYRVSVSVHDNSPGISTCFLADVCVRDQNGVVLAEWFDRSGQYSADGVRELVASMRWMDKQTLAFDSMVGLDRSSPREKVVLSVAGAATAIPAVADAEAGEEG